MRAAVARSDVRAKERNELDLPSDEHVLWASFWMVEIYLATHTPDLKKGFARLGWTEDVPGLGSIDAEKWLDDARTGHGLSWTRLGFFRPRGSALFPTATPIELSKSFAFLSAALVQMGPGVTALITNFALAEDEQGCLEKALREAPSARGEPVGAVGYRILSPEVVRAERVAAERERIRNEAASWIRENLPGAFSASREDPPTWDLITTEKEDLIKDLRGPFGWQDILGFRGANQWVFTAGGSNTKLGIPNSFMDESNPAPTFFGCYQDLIDGLGKGHDDSVYSLVQSLDDDLEYLLPLWATVRAVEGYDRALSIARDQQLPSRAGYGATRSQLRRSREVILPTARDLVTLEGLGNWLGDEQVKKWFQRGSAGLKPSKPSRESSNVAMTTWLIQRLADESSLVRQRADNDTKSLQAYSETLVASSNLRLQLTVLAFSAVVAALTVVTVIWR
jgi:hypothetical protein